MKNLNTCNAAKTIWSEWNGLRLLDLVDLKIKGISTGLLKGHILLSRHGDIFEYHLQKLLTRRKDEEPFG